MMTNPMRHMTGALLALFFLAAAGPAPVDRDALIDEVSGLVAQHYIQEAKRAEIIRSLKAHRLSFSQNDPLQFARDVSTDFFVTSSDKHLKLIYDPVLHEALKHPVSHPSQMATPNLRAATRNYGVPEARLMDGNLGYIRISNFEGGHEAMRRVDAAFAFLSGADALILDLRGNGGGDADFVRYVQGYFFERPTLVMRFKDPGRADLQDSYSRQPQGVPRPGRPLVVLIDGRTASAAEDLAYSARAFGLGKLVGETTAGAAFTVSRFSVGEGYVLSVSTGKPVHPKTGENWEAVGVAPDVTATPQSALLTGQMTALELLMAGEPQAARRGIYEWAHLALAAELEPPVLPLPDYLALTGSYGVGRVVYSNDVLTFIPQGGTAVALSPLSRDDFKIAGTDSYRFHFDFSGTRPVLERVFADGRKDRFELLHK